MSEQSRPSYEFGPFSVDAGKRLLLRNGEPVPLAPKVLETLLALIENRERIVTKDELLTYVWGDTSVEEGGLTRNVSILRKALGEKPDDHQYIVTVPARGYRFVAEVREPLGKSEAPGARCWRVRNKSPDHERMFRRIAGWYSAGWQRSHWEPSHMYCALFVPPKQGVRPSPRSPSCHCRISRATRRRTTSLTE